MPGLTEKTCLPAMLPESVAKVAALEEELLRHPQVDIGTEHVFHAGTYARTIKLPEGAVLTGAAIKIPTLLIVSGDVLVYTGINSIRLTGYHVVPAAKGRKQVFVAVGETHMTMLFATSATTVEEAEKEFTDEYDKLLSRRETSP